MKRKQHYMTFRTEGIRFDLPEEFQEEQPEGDNQFLGTFLVGDQEIQGIYFPAEEIKKGAETMERQPVNLDHSFSVEDEVGFVSNVSMLDAALRGIVNLSPETKEFDTAQSFIRNRKAAGKPAEVSVGVFLDIVERHDPETDETRLEARNLSFDHLALVVRGACGPGEGCGIGLKRIKQGDTDMCEETKKQLKAVQEELDAAQDALAEYEDSEVEAMADRLESLQEEYDDLQEEFDSMKEELDGYKEAEIEELRAEAEELGVPVDDEDDYDTLSDKVDLAQAVAEKHGRKAPDQPDGDKPRRHTRKGTGGKTSGAEALLARMGLTG